MRIITFILLLLSIIDNIYSQDWKYLSKIGESENINSVFFLNQYIGYSVTTSGKVYNTCDGGIIWKNIYKFSSQIASDENIHKILFNNSKEGWILAGKMLLFTKDSASTWSEKLNVDGYFHDISFPNNKVGFVFGMIYHANIIDGNIVNTWEPMIYKTIDGGENWKSIKIKDSNGIVNSYFLNENIGWIVDSKGQVFKTLDSGESWVLNGACIPLDLTSNLTDLFFIDENIGFACGELFNWHLGGYIFKTINGGQTWIKTDFNDNNGGLRSFKFINESEIYAVGKYGTLIHSRDCGINWLRIELEQSTDSWFDCYFNDIYFKDGKSWIVSDHGQIYKNDNVTGFDNVTNLDKYKIYPNPANEYIIIESKGSDYITSIEIYDVTNRQVINKSNSSKKSKSEINISTLVEGIYLIKMKTESNKRIISKLLKK